MKYIKNYNNHYNMITEKITWREILFFASLFYIGTHSYSYYQNYQNDREIKKLYYEVNSTTNYPQGKEKELIEKIKHDVILDRKSVV